MAEDSFEQDLRPLWDRARAGDEAAYKSALQVIAARLRAYYRRRLAGAPDEVEDLVQDTLLALHLRRGTHDPALPVSNWIHAIAGYKLVDLWRRRRRQGTGGLSLDAVEELPATGEVAAEDRVGRGRDLDWLLAGLPDAQAKAIRLTRLDGLSMAEAAAKTGVSVAALKVQVHRGLKRLAVRARDQK